MDSKASYKELCNRETSIPIFSQYWWLDAVAGDNWDVVLYEKGGEIVGALPYVINKKFLFSSISQPVLTQHLGPWLRGSSDKFSTQLSQEKEILENLFEQLPYASKYSQNWSPLRQNWLPLYWKGYKQTTFYTYRLEDISDLKKIWDGFDGSIRKEIRKAENRFKLQVIENPPLCEFLSLNKKVFVRQELPLPYSDEQVSNLYNALDKRNKVKLFIARDESGNNHAGVFLIWDENVAYYLMGGGDPDLRNSGAASLCMWKAIQFASSVTNGFDFEGSIIEPIEKFFRSFNARQIPYFHVFKYNSKFLKLVSELRNFI